MEKCRFWWLLASEVLHLPLFLESPKTVDLLRSRVGKGHICFLYGFRMAQNVPRIYNRCRFGAACVCASVPLSSCHDSCCCCSCSCSLAVAHHRSPLPRLPLLSLSLPISLFFCSLLLPAESCANSLSQFGFELAFTKFFCSFFFFFVDVVSSSCCLCSQLLLLLL